MRAVATTTYGTAETLRFQEVPIPEPNDNQLLIKVLACSVNPIDWKILRGDFKIITGRKPPLILGGGSARLNWLTAMITARVRSTMAPLSRILLLYKAFISTEQQRRHGLHFLLDSNYSCNTLMVGGDQLGSGHSGAMPGVAGNGQSSGP